MDLGKMFEDGRYEDVLKLVRYFYRIGSPLVSDREYEDFLRFVKGLAPAWFTGYETRSYDDDDIPVGLLKEFGIRPVTVGVPENRGDLVRYLDAEKSRSIETATGYRKAFDFFSQYRRLGKDLVLSLKIDGVNTKNLYLNGEYCLGMSRGRSGNGFDWTDNLSRILPKSTAFSQNEVKVMGECLVLPDYLPKLREKYHSDKYKTAKSAAISLLRVEHDAEDYGNLRLFCFGAENISDSLIETLYALERNGFRTVPYVKVTANGIPGEYGVFKRWLKQRLDCLWKAGKGIQSDGVVAEVDDLTFSGVTKGQYCSRQLALKFEYWSYQYYIGEVVDVLWRQQRVVASVRVSIKPMHTSDGCVATTINVFNPSLVISCGLKKGSKVYFERNSGAVNILLYGERLERALNGGTDE